MISFRAPVGHRRRMELLAAELIEKGLTRLAKGAMMPPVVRSPSKCRGSA